MNELVIEDCESLVEYILNTQLNFIPHEYTHTHTHSLSLSHTHTHTWICMYVLKVFSNVLKIKTFLNI